MKMTNVMNCGFALVFLTWQTSMISANAQVYANYSFDESGNWWSSVFGAHGQVTQQIPGGGIQYDLTFLVDIFPFPLGRVVNQTYGFFETGKSFDLANLSDVIHIDDDRHFSYYSNTGKTDLADLSSGSLSGLIADHGWALPSQNMFYFYESDSYGNNYFTLFVPTDHGTISFYGESNVPEPAVFGMVIVGGLLGLCRLLRRKKS